MKLTWMLGLAAGLLATVAAVASTAEEGAKAPAKSEVKTPFFGNAKCPLSTEDVDQAVYQEKNGERIYFCCNNCKAKAAADFEGTYEKAYPKDQVVDLKNTMCPVMGKAIDPADHPTVTVQGRQVHLCCEGCDKKLRKGANHYLALVADPALVPLKNKKCIVSGSDATTANCYVYDGVLIDACCEKCVAAFEKDPSKFLTAAGVDVAKVKADAAAAKAKKDEKPAEKKKDG